LRQGGGLAAYQGRHIRMQKRKASIRARARARVVSEGGGGGGNKGGEERRRFYILRRRGRILGRDGRAVPPAITETPGIPLGKRNIYAARCAAERGNGRNE